MHIAYVTPEFVTEGCSGGGLASYLANISRIFAKRGHLVTIITLSSINDDKIIWDQNIEVERVNIASITKVFENGILSKILASVRLNNRLSKIHNVRKIDIVQYSNYESVALCRKREIPTIIRLSSDGILWRATKYIDFDWNKDYKKFNLLDLLEYHSDKQADCLFAPSNVVADITRQRINRNVYVIESPFYLKNENFDYSLYKEKLEGKKYLLAHSSMSCLKGTHIFAQSLEKILERYSDLYVVFCGGDHGIWYKSGKIVKALDYVMQYAGKYSDRVIYLGTQSREKLYPVICNAFACVQPSRIDNMPNTCIEAMALGKVVIGTKGASYEQLIENGKSGLLIERDSVDELIDAIDKLLDLSPDKIKLMENAARKISERFDESIVYDKMIRLYNEVIHRK